MLRQAEEIRELVARVEKAIARGALAKDGGAKLVRWKVWATAQADKNHPVMPAQVLEHIYVAELDNELREPGA